MRCASVSISCTAMSGSSCTSGRNCHDVNPARYRSVRAVAGADRAPLLAVHRHGRLALEDDEEADAALALHDDVGAGRDAAVAHLRRDACEGLLVQALEERHLLEL